MRKNPYHHLFQALPAYFGGKRKLTPWIFKLLAERIPRSHWSKLTFLDAFAGGCSVSLFAKAQGFEQILANDLSSRSQIILNALLVNQSVHLSASDMLYLTHASVLPQEARRIEQEFGGSVFSKRHAHAMDGYVYWLTQIQDPTKQALGKLLLWHLLSGFVCMGTSIGTSNRPYAEVLDGTRDWQTLNPKRFVDDSFPKLLKPVWEKLESKRQAINAGVFRGSPVQAFQQNALEFVRQAQGDILYLDPPYPQTLSYEKSHTVLDAVLLGQQVKQPVSPFSQGIEALEQLLDQAHHLPTWILSYGNAVVSLDELVALVKRQAKGRQVEGFARSYTHMPQVSKNTQNQELLIIAR